MNNFADEYRDEIIQHVNDSFIDPREPLHGGRTEVFKTFYEIKASDEIILGFDISPQYPAITALGFNAIGAKKSKRYTVFGFLASQLKLNIWAVVVRA
jgi:hypothetical protein